MEKQRIFEIANQLFSISEELKEVNEIISQLVLFTADRTLRIYEGKENNPCVQPQGNIQKGMERCEDCGGLKPKGIPEGMERCEDCGGLRPIGGSCPQPENKTEPDERNFGNDIVTVEDSVADDMSTMCHGHTENNNCCNGHSADGSGTQSDSQPQQGEMNQKLPTTSEQGVKSEIESLVNKIRNEMGEK